MAKRVYSDEQKGSALAILDATKVGGVPDFAEAARLTKMPESTLREWDRGRYVSSVVAEIRKRKRGELADEMELGAAALVFRLIELAPGETDMKAVTAAMSAAVDKMQILRGKPSEIVEDACLTDAERADRIAALLERAREKRARQAPDAPVA